MIVSKLMIFKQNKKERNLKKGKKGKFIKIQIIF